VHQLRNSHLRRLAIWDSDITEEDIKAIAQLSSLETLEVLSQAPTEEQLEQFSHLPNLKRLCILELGKPVKQSYKFAKLFDWATHFSVDENHPTPWFGQWD
jgi:hypothetical protein